MTIDYQLVYSVSSLLGLYARYNFLKVFYDEKENVLERDLSLYTLFYIVSNGLYLAYDLPIINLAVQMFFIFIIAYVKSTNAKKASLATSIIIIIIVATESLVVFITGYVADSVFVKGEYQSILGIASVNILTLLLSKMISNYRNAGEDIDLSLSCWFPIVVFPIMSLGLLMIIFSLKSGSQGAIIMTTLIILMMNLIIFWLYDRLMWKYKQKLDEVVIAQLNMSYKKQLEIMRASILEVKSFQHDVKRHFASIDTLMQENRYGDLKEYIDEMKASVTIDRAIIKTGNIIVDSVINFELNRSQIQDENFEFKAIDLPCELGIKDYDLTVILSNILTNALRAGQEVEEGSVSLLCSYRKGVLLIRIENDYKSPLIVKNNKLQTSKKDKNNHGYGLENVRNTVNKYDGEVTINYDDKTFELVVLLYEK